MILCSTKFFGQTYSVASPHPNFIGVENGSIAFSDIDGDNDQDVLITGFATTGMLEAKLYTNDGGTFTEVTGTPFEGVRSGSVAFADVDGDNDLDVLITGRADLGVFTAKLYTNNGTGTFTEVTGTPFDGVINSSVAFADVDGDNDQDVIISGLATGNYIAKLYTNNGGTFTEATGTPFEGVNESSVAFADVDGDNDQDLVISGENGSSVSITKLYTNNGGVFTEVTGTPFNAVWLGSVAFADINGDNLVDILITGENESGDPSATLYVTDGSLSVDDSNLQNNVTVYYNTNTKGLVLNATQTTHTNVEVFNILGQKSKSKTLNSIEAELDLSDLTTGIYIAKITTTNGIKTIKFVKN